MKRIKFSIMTFFILFVFISPEVLAADLSVTCDPDGCSTSGMEPLFDEDNIYPGWSVTRTLKAKNEYNEDREFMIEVDDLDTSGSFSLAGLLEIIINEDGDTDLIYGPATLDDWEDEDDLPLSYIDEGDSTTYELTVSMPATAGNDFQGKSTDFDLKLGFDMVETDDDDEGGEVAGSTTSIFTFLGTGGPLLGGEVAGDETVIPGEVGGIEETAGESVCIDPWWWWLVFLAQVLLHLLVKYVLKEKVPSFVSVVQLLMTIVFIAIFWKFFCPTWDMFVSALLGLLALIWSFKKRDPHQYTNYH